MPYRLYFSFRSANGPRDPLYPQTDVVPTTPLSNSDIAPRSDRPNTESNTTQTFCHKVIHTLPTPPSPPSRGYPQAYRRTGTAYSKYKGYYSNTQPVPP